jgi:hypothetical protein
MGAIVAVIVLIAIVYTTWYQVRLGFTGRGFLSSVLVAGGLLITGAVMCGAPPWGFLGGLIVAIMGWRAGGGQSHSMA